jgi:archaemetzincin
MLTLEIFYESFSEEVLSAVRKALQRTYPLKVTLGTEMKPPIGAKDEERSQYDASLLLEFLSKNKTKDLALWLVNCDIFIVGMNFVFGVAYEREAIVSTYRLPSLEMISKESIHEVGHLLSLEHCSNNCVMKFSNTFAEAMKKPSKLCKNCEAQIKKLFASEEKEISSV